MSILQEYESIHYTLGDDTWNAIDEYLATERTDLLLSDVLYKEKCWNDFENWYKERNKK